MSTLPHIQATAHADPQENQGAAVGNFSGAPAGLAGLFEEVMAQVLSPSSKNAVTPSEKNPLSQNPVQTANRPLVNGAFQKNLKLAAISADVASDILPAQLTSIQSRTSGKTSTKSGEEGSNNDNHSGAKNEPANAIASAEALIKQMLAGMTANPASEASPKTLTVTAPAIPNTATAKAAAVPATPAKETSAAATKISGSDLSENPVTATAPTAVSQKPSQMAGKEIGVTEKNPELPADATASAWTNVKPATEGKNSSSQGTESGADATPSPPSEANGTSVAKQDVAMKESEKTNNIAGQTEKVLPGNGMIGARASVPPYISSAHSEQLTTISVTDSSQVAGNNVASTMSLDSVAGSPTPDVRTRLLERTQEMVTVNATRLSDSGNNSMQVVIKPDAGTQLSLELRQQGGSVQVHAVLQQGNFGHLNQQWPDLQQRLEQRGIKLGPLTDDAPFANSGGYETFQNKQSPGSEKTPEVTLIDMPAAMFAPEPAQAAAHRGWETWA